MRIIILFAIVLVAILKTSGASPISRWEENKGQATVIIAPATPWENIYPGETAKAGSQQADSSKFLSRSSNQRTLKKKWFAKRWIFRPPMEPN